MRAVVLTGAGEVFQRRRRHAGAAETRPRRRRPGAHGAGEAGPLPAVDPEADYWRDQRRLRGRLVRACALLRHSFRRSGGEDDHGIRAPRTDRRVRRLVAAAAADRPVAGARSAAFRPGDLGRGSAATRSRQCGLSAGGVGRPGGRLRSGSGGQLLAGFHGGDQEPGLRRLRRYARRVGRRGRAQKWRRRSGGPTSRKAWRALSRSAKPHSPPLPAGSTE